MTPKLKKILIIVLVIATAFVVYTIFLKDRVQESTVVTGRSSQTVSAQEARIIGDQITQALLKIQQIKFDMSIFSNSLFLSLTDQSRPIEDEPIGRDNPFAPLKDTSVNIPGRMSIDPPSDVPEPSY